MRNAKVKKRKKKKKPVPRNGLGQYPKGVSGCPTGRPKGSTNRYSLAELACGIKNVEKKKRRKFIEVWIEAAWGDATAMGNIMSFMLPKLRSVEALVAAFESTMTDEEAQVIRDKLKGRFN